MSTERERRTSRQKSRVNGHGASGNLLDDEARKHLMIQALREVEESSNGNFMTSRTKANHDDNRDDGRSDNSSSEDSEEEEDEDDDEEETSVWKRTLAMYGPSGIRNETQNWHKFRVLQRPPMNIIASRLPFMKPSSTPEINPSRLEVSDQPFPYAPKPVQDHIPGSIVSISVKNFLTYDQARFNAGPSVNMIIGPNGSGKSAFVNAICLGLGFSPKLLGRASTLSEFVRFREDKATIVIELKGHDDDHVFIRTEIQRETNSQRFFVNDRSCTHAEVSKIVRSFKVQVDNLCQFLPQDRVVEFARLDEVALFRETLRAIAEPDFYQMYERLLASQDQLENLSRTISSLSEQLTVAQNRRGTLEEEAERRKEREALRTQIESLQGALLFARYTEAREEFLAKKRIHWNEVKKFKKLERACDPTRGIHGQYQAAHETLIARGAEWKQWVVNKMEKIQSEREQLNSRLEPVESLRAKRQGEARYRTQWEGEVRETVSKLRELEARRKIAHPPYESIINGLRDELREQTEKAEEARRERAQINGITQQSGYEIDKCRRKVSEIEGDIRQIDSLEGRRMIALQRFNAEAYNAWMWVRSHGDRLKQEVFGPPAILCSTSDGRLADMLENLLTGSDLFCFTVQCKEDLDTLLEVFLNELGVSVSVRLQTASFATYQAERIFVNDELRAHEFDGLAIDYLQGPDPVLAMLCATGHFHKTPITHKRVSKQSKTFMERHRDVPRFATNNVVYRKVGSGLAGDVVRDARFWKASAEGADGFEREKERKTQLLREVQLQLQDHKTNYEQAVARHREFSEAAEAAQHEVQTLHVKIEDTIAKMRKWKRLPQEIELCREAALRQQERIRKTKTKRIALEVSIRRDMLAVASASRQTQTGSRTSASRPVKILHKSALATQEMIYLEAEALDMAEMMRLHEGQLHKARKERDEVRKNVDSLHAEAAAAHKIVSANRGQFVEFTEQHPDLECIPLAADKTVDQLQGEIAAEQSNLELMGGGGGGGGYGHNDPNAASRYDKLVEDMDRMEATLSGHVEDRVRLSEDIQQYLDRFNPYIDGLLRDASIAFSCMMIANGCAGEIRLERTSEKVGTWAIHIMVSFRVHENDGKLVRLTAQRQSGGERSVATIYFLLSLQAYSQAPFRVVDEINQGMDPFNERRVHNKLVTMSRSNACQYFLITPKLLEGLDYPPEMTVINVNNSQSIEDTVVARDRGRYLQGSLDSLHHQLATLQSFGEE